MTQSPLLKQVYIQSNSEFNLDFYTLSLSESISLLRNSSHFLCKITKLLYDEPKTDTNCFAHYYPHFKEKLGIIEATYYLFLLRPPPTLIDLTQNSSYFRSPPKLLFLSGVSSNSIVKFIPQYPHYKIKLINKFGTYNSNHTEKLVSNPNLSSIYTVNCFYFLYSLDSLSNLSKASLFAYNGGACTND